MLMNSGHDTLKPPGIYFGPVTNSVHDSTCHKWPRMFLGRIGWWNLPWHAIFAYIDWSVLSCFANLGILPNTSISNWHEICDLYVLDKNTMDIGNILLSFMYIFRYWIRSLHSMLTKGFAFHMIYIINVFAVWWKFQHVCWHLIFSIDSVINSSSQKK